MGAGCRASGDLLDARLVVHAPLGRSAVRDKAVHVLDEKGAALLAQLTPALRGSRCWPIGKSASIFAWQKPLKAPRLSLQRNLLSTRSAAAADGADSKSARSFSPASTDTSRVYAHVSGQPPPRTANT